MRYPIMQTSGFLALAFSVSHPAFAASFTPLGDLPGGGFESHATAISADGSTVVGYGTVAGGGTEAFRWTRGGGMESLGVLPGGDHLSYASAVSADGTVIAGYSGSGSGYQAFRWTQATGLTGLGGLDANDGFTRASGISADGSIIVGYSQTSAHPMGSGYRWSEAAGMVDMGQLPGDIWSWARAISADGSVIVGQSNTLTDGQAFRWTAEDGMIGLGKLPGAASSGASGVSDDGTVIAGGGKVGDFNYAMVWTEEGGWENLGTLPGYQNSNTNAVSGDGTLVVGQSFNFDSATSTFTSEGFIWDEANGMRNVKDWLMDEYGLDLAPWTIGNVLGVSGDGRFIAGYGVNPDGNTEAWLADLSPAPVPLPAAFWLLASGLMALGGAARNGRRIV